jgi:hypothetical protein
MSDLSPMELLLQEVRDLRQDFKDLRNDFHEAQVSAAADKGERKGRTAMLSAVVSLLVAFAAAVIQAVWPHKP